jgi:hypothetical protein
MTSELFKYPPEWNGGISCSANDYYVNAPQKWPELVKPYLPICVSSPKTEYVMRDLYHKINGMDHCLGRGLLPGLCRCDTVFTFWVEKFLSVGADPNTPCFGQGESILEGGNALHFAVYYKHFAVADVLLDVVADPNAKTARGKTALDLMPAADVVSNETSNDDNSDVSALRARLVRYNT